MAIDFDALLKKISPPETPAPTVNKQATLSSPDGRYKTVVAVGGTEASNLMKQGWNLGDSGKSIVTTTGGKVIAPTVTAPAIKTTTPTAKTTSGLTVTNQPITNPANAKINVVSQPTNNQTISKVAPTQTTTKPLTVTETPKTTTTKPLTVTSTPKTGEINKVTGAPPTTITASSNQSQPSLLNRVVSGWETAGNIISKPAKYIADQFAQSVKEDFAYWKETVKTGKTPYSLNEIGDKYVKTFSEPAKAALKSFATQGATTALTIAQAGIEVSNQLNQKINADYDPTWANNTAQKISTIVSEAKDGIKQIAKDAGVNEKEGVLSPENFIYGVANGGASMAAAVGVGILTGSLSAGAAILSLLESSDTYQRARESGKSPAKAAAIATQEGVVTYALEKLGFEMMFKNFGGGKVFNTAIKAVTETVQESSQTIWQNIVDKVSVQGQVPNVKDVFAGLVETIAYTLPIGGIGGASITHIQQNSNYFDNLAKHTGLPKAELTKLAEKVVVELDKKAEVIKQAEGGYTPAPIGIKVDTPTAPAITAKPTAETITIRPAKTKTATIPQAETIKAPEVKTAEEAKASSQSFDEWVKGQGKTVYHGTTASNMKDITEIKPGDIVKPNEGYSKFVYLSENPNTAKGYSSSKAFNGKLLDGVLKGEILDAPEGLSYLDFEANPLLAKKYIERGYSAIRFPEGDSTQLMLLKSEALKTRSQLKAEWDAIPSKTMTASEAKASGQSFDENLWKVAEKDAKFYIGDTPTKRGNLKISEIHGTGLKSSETINPNADLKKPVVVVKTSSGYQLLDGRNRIAQLEKQGIDRVDVIIADKSLGDNVPSKTMTAQEAKASDQSFDEWVKGQGDELTQEALKYNNINEFSQALYERPTINDEVGRLGRLLNNDNNPQKIYENYKNSKTWQEQFVSKNSQFKNGIPTEITIYRTGDGNIRPGDFVATDRNIAKMENPGVKLYSKKVKADEILWTGTDAGEWYYAPKQYQVKIDDVWNKSLKTRSQFKAEWDKAPEVKTETSAPAKTQTAAIPQAETIKAPEVKTAEQAKASGQSFDEWVKGELGKEVRFVKTDTLDIYETAINRKLVDNIKKQIQDGDFVGAMKHRERIGNAPAIRIEDGKVIDGNHRLIALKELGIKEAPVEIIGSLGKAELTTSTQLKAEWDKAPEVKTETPASAKTVDNFDAFVEDMFTKADTATNEETKTAALTEIEQAQTAELAKLEKEFKSQNTMGEYQDQYSDFLKLIKDPKMRNQQTRELLETGDAERFKKIVIEKGLLDSESLDNLLWTQEMGENDLYDLFMAKAMTDLNAQSLKTRQEKIKKIKEVFVSRSQLPVGEGPERISRLEARVKNLFGSFTRDQIEEYGLTTYQQVNKKENIAKAAEYVINNPKKAMAVIKGEKEPPAGILKNSIVVAMAEAARDDSGLALRVASAGATRMGQEISVLSEIDDTSPVKYLKELIQLKERIAEKLRGGVSADAIKTKIKNGMKTAIRTAKMDKYSWETLVNEITC